MYFIFFIRHAVAARSRGTYTLTRRNGEENSEHHWWKEVKEERKKKERKEIARTTGQGERGSGSGRKGERKWGKMVLVVLVLVPVQWWRWLVRCWMAEEESGRRLKRGCRKIPHGCCLRFVNSWWKRLCAFAHWELGLHCNHYHSHACTRKHLQRYPHFPKTYSVSRETDAFRECITFSSVPWEPPL